MANSSNSMRKSMLFWLGASLLVLAGMCLDCAKPTQTAITITGKKPDNYNVDSDPVSVIRKNGDSVSWTNKSYGTDVMVCIDEGANPDDHVFNETRYVAKSGGKVPSSVAKSSAQLGPHTYYVLTEAPKCPALPPAVPPGGEGVLTAPRTITVK